MQPSEIASDGSEPPEADRFVVAIEDRHQWARLPAAKHAVELFDRASLEAAAGVTPAARGRGRWRQSIDNNRFDGNRAGRQRLERVPRFLDGHRFRQGHPDDASSGRVAYYLGQLAAIVFETGNERIGGIIAPAAAKRLDHDAVAGLHRVEYAGNPAERIGHVEHPHGVTRRGRVDDDQVVAAGTDETNNLEECRELVDARKRQLQQP